MQKNNFPLHFCEIWLFWIAQKTISCESKNFFLTYGYFFKISVLPLSVFSIRSFKVNGNTPPVTVVQTPVCVVPHHQCLHLLAAFGKELRLQSTTTSTTLKPLTLSWPLEKNNLGHTFWDWAKRTPKKIHLVGQACYSIPQSIFIVDELAYSVGSEGKWACEVHLLNCKASSTHYWQFVLVLQWLSVFYFLCTVLHYLWWPLLILTPAEE